VDDNREDLAWAAGLFDGEGNVGFYNRVHIMMNISQCDRWVLDRFQTIVGRGAIYGPYPRSVNRNWTPIHAYSVGKYEDVQYIVALLWRWLSPVKRAQASEALRGYQQRPLKVRMPSRDGLLCARGHSMTDPFLHRRVDGTYDRECRQCKHDNAHAAYLRRKAKKQAP
jgi:hypothetical protein